MASTPEDIKRQGTMQQTAQEGIQFLKDAKADVLLQNNLRNENFKQQGLMEPGEQNGHTAKNGDSNGVAKQNTMEATAKEGEILVEWMGGGVDPEARTRGQQKHLAQEKNGKNHDEGAEDEAPEAKKVKRDGTMKETVKEAETVLAGEVLGETRAETAALNESSEEAITPKKTHTMAETSKEAATILEGEGDIGSSRSESATIKEVEDQTQSSRKRKSHE